MRNHPGAVVSLAFAVLVTCAALPRAAQDAAGISADGGPTRVLSW